MLNFINKLFILTIKIYYTGAGDPPSFRVEKLIIMIYGNLIIILNYPFLFILLIVYKCYYIDIFVQNNRIQRILKKIRTIKYDLHRK